MYLFHSGELLEWVPLAARVRVLQMSLGEEDGTEGPRARGERRHELVTGRGKEGRSLLVMW